MRRALALLLLFQLFVPELPARNHRDWANAKKLKSGTVVEICLWSGKNITGEIDTVDDAGLQLVTASSSGTQSGGPRDIPRSDIHQIVRLRQLNLPDSGAWMARGAIAGGAVGLTIGAVSDVRHGTNGRWVLDGLGGAAVGFVFSCGALLAVGAVDIGRGIHRNHNKVVYEDTSIRSTGSRTAAT